MIIALVLFVMRKKKARENIVEDSKKHNREELELGNRVGEVMDVQNEYPL